MDRYKPSPPAPPEEDADHWLDTSLIGEEAALFRDGMEARVIGQPEAVDQITHAYQRWISGMTEPGHPISNMLFLGPSGTGKTRTVEATADVILKNPRAVVKIDCAEFQHSHEIAKLIGSPPGYLGHRETHPLLTQEVLNQYHTDTVKISFVLFDEIEKASDALWNLLLGVLDKAVLTLGDNRKVDFARTMIFMTGNIGAVEIGKITAGGLGFAPRPADDSADRIQKVAQAAARRKFTPEFMNRLDNVIVFRPLSEATLERILGIELGIVQHSILNAPGLAPFMLRTDITARALLLQQGLDRTYGARFLKRTIGRLLTSPLSNLSASGQINNGDMVEASCAPGAEVLRFRKVVVGMKLNQMLTEIGEYNALPFTPVSPAIPIVAPAAVPAPVPVDPMRQRAMPYNGRKDRR